MSKKILKESNRKQFANDAVVAYCAVTAIRRAIYRGNHDSVHFNKGGVRCSALARTCPVQLDAFIQCVQHSQALASVPTRQVEDAMKYNPIIEALVARRQFCFVGQSASAFEYKLWFSNQLTR